MSTLDIDKMVEAGTSEDKIYLAGQWQLVWWKLRRHKLAISGATVLLCLYSFALFCEFFSPYDVDQWHTNVAYAPPQRLRLFDGSRFHLRPFVYGLSLTRDPETLRKIYVPDKDNKSPVYFFVRGNPYKLWNLLATDIHFFGIKDEGTIFLLGTDRMGRDVLSRILYGARISLFIGLIGVFLSFGIGLLLGGISGYYGGSADIVIQRIMEFLRSIPIIPLWMSLSAALPPDWSPIKVYFGITIILSIVGWTNIARVVRGKLLALREEDFTMAAMLAGASELRIIVRHLLPAFLSHIIVAVTLNIPRMIIGETSLSFLGIGLRPPAVSWGVLLQEAQNVRNVALYPWLMLPVIFVIFTVLAFNFFGDGLRDAADPYVT